MFFNFSSKTQELKSQYESKLNEMSADFEAKITQLQEDSNSRLESAYATIVLKDAEIEQLKKQIEELKEHEEQIVEAVQATDEKIEEIAEIKATEILSNIGHEPVDFDINTDESISMEELFKDYQKNRNTILNLLNK